TVRSRAGGVADFPTGPPLTTSSKANGWSTNGQTSAQSREETVPPGMTSFGDRQTQRSGLHFGPRCRQLGEIMLMPV
ncbi:hypothetical protein ACYOEI_33940, partial [Singulisphaera rosea]